MKEILVKQTQKENTAMHYRKMIPVPPPVPSRPTLMEQIWAYSEKVRKNMAFWWRFNNESVYGGIAVCVIFVIFLLCSLIVYILPAVSIAMPLGFVPVVPNMLDPDTLFLTSHAELV
jgi:hypothetical protein